MNECNLCADVKRHQLTGLFQILKADIVHGEEGCRGAVLWAHVGDGGSVSDRQLSHTWAEELHEFSYHAHLTEVLRAHAESTAVTSER